MHLILDLSGIAALKYLHIHTLNSFASQKVFQEFSKTVGKKPLWLKPGMRHFSTDLFFTMQELTAVFGYFNDEGQQVELLSFF